MAPASAGAISVVVDFNAVRGNPQSELNRRVAGNYPERVEKEKVSLETLYRRSVVVVEDDAFMRSLIAEYLEKAGFLVSTAGTAADAHRQIKAMDPDAVVLDIDLGPGPSGLDIAKGLNTSSNEIGLVFLTNFSDPRFAGYDPKTAHPHAAYLNKHMMEDSSVLLDALNAVLLERDIKQFRFDQRVDRPLAHLSSSQIQALRLISEGKTNRQIAEIRQRSVAATESLVSRTLEALGFSAASDVNARVAAARQFMKMVGTPRSDVPARDR
jgi:DNA-binding NarL/FixJ family response regulator